MGDIGNTPFQQGAIFYGCDRRYMAYKPHKIKKGMGGSRCGRGRTEKTEVLKTQSDKLRRQESKDLIAEELKDIQIEGREEQ